MLRCTKNRQLRPLAVPERVMELLQLPRELTYKWVPQHPGPDGAPEHSKGAPRHGGHRLAHRVEPVSPDLGAHCRGLSPSLSSHSGRWRWVWLEVNQLVVIGGGLVVRSQFLVDLGQVLDELCRQAAGTQLGHRFFKSEHRL